MSSDETAPFVLGNKFASYEQLKTYINLYEHKAKQKLTTFNSKTIKGAKLKKCLKKELVYHNITFVCIHGGGDFKSKGQGIRKTSTYRTGCPFKIKFKVTADGNFLEVVAVCCNHAGHELTEKVFEQSKKINTYEPNERKNVFEIGRNSKSIQINLEAGKQIWNNETSKLRDDTNDLYNAVQLLKGEYNADVTILQDGDNNFKALYFSTKNMRKSMESFPEIVFIDGPYELISNGLTFMLTILSVEDANGLSEVVGVCLIQNEDYDALKWFFTNFKADNEIASNSIRCFMGEKDALQRKVLGEIFVGVPVYICLFHTLKTFKKQITTANFKIDKIERETCWELLTKLVYSSSERIYAEFYEIFQDRCPPDVVNYFNNNWHTIRSEWTCYSTVHGNLKNKTNNRLESLNHKIKSVMPLNSLCDFFKHFFDWLNSHNAKRNLKVAKIILKKPVTNFNKDSCEKKYLDLLTPFAYSHVIRECNFSEKVTILQNVNGTFEVDGNSDVKVTSTDCDCGDFSSMLLPCRHILALRRHLNIPLFCEELCNQRWTRLYLVNHRALLEETPKNCVANSKVDFAVFNDSEQRKCLSAVCDSLVNLACLSSNSEFQYKMECLKKLEYCWREDIEVRIEKNGCDVAIKQAVNDEENKDEYDQNKVGMHNSANCFDSNSINIVIKDDIDRDIDICRQEEICNAETYNNSEDELHDKDESGEGEKYNNIIEENNIELKNTSKKIRKERPLKSKGKLNVTIGPKKRRIGKIPTRYQLKTKQMKQIEILKTILFKKDTDIINQCLNDGYKIKYVDLISNVEDISHSLLDSEIDLNIVQMFLEPTAFMHLMQLIEDKRQNYDWCCIYCSDPLGDIKSICCNSCLKWYHLKCVGLAKIPARKVWFCRGCYM